MMTIPKIFKALLEICKEYGPGMVGYVVVLLLMAVLYIESEKRTTMILEQQNKTIEQIVQHSIHQHEDKKLQEHKRKYQARIKAAPLINNTLATYMDRIGADHIFIGEYHNGEENIATGIPFCKFSMTAEHYDVDLGTSFIQRFTNENITKYNILPYMLTKHMVKYTIDELETIDYYLYLQLRSFNVKSIVICSMSDFDNYPMGFIGCVLYEKDKDINTHELISCKDEIKQILIDINKDYSNKKFNKTQN